MSTYSLFQDVDDLRTIVNTADWGWPGAYWSGGIFVADAWAIATGQHTELARRTRKWRARLELPDCIATWSQQSGELIVHDDTPGLKAERYLGVVYDPVRWEGLLPDAFRAAVIAGLSCPATVAATAQALVDATTTQLASLASADVRMLLEHRDAAVREAVADLYTSAPAGTFPCDETASAVFRCSPAAVSKSKARSP